MYRYMYLVISIIINFTEDFNRSFLGLRLDLKSPELELELELKSPELELELGLKLIVSGGIGIGIENNGIGIGIELKKWNWPQPCFLFIHLLNLPSFSLVVEQEAVPLVVPALTWHPRLSWGALCQTWPANSPPARHQTSCVWWSGWSCVVSADWRLCAAWVSWVVMAAVLPSLCLMGTSPTPAPGALQKQDTNIIDTLKPRQNGRQTIFLNSFSHIIFIVFWMKSLLEFVLKGLISNKPIMTCTKQVTSLYLYQSLIYWHLYMSLGFDELTHGPHDDVNLILDT